MELKRILAKDTRSAMELATARYGKDVLVVSSQSVAGQVELVVALDVQPPPEPAPAARGNGAAFAAALRASVARPLPAGGDHLSAAQALAARAADTATVPAPVAASPAVVPAVVPAVAAAAAEAADARALALVDQVRREIAALRQEMTLRGQVEQWQASQQLPGELTRASAWLADAGVPAALRALLVEGAREARGPEAIAAAMQAQLAGALDALGRIALPLQGLHALFGPSGAGKTHMAVRLARQAALRGRADDVALVSYADRRCGAWSQLRVLATQAGVPCYRAHDEAALDLLREELGDRALVLLDVGAQREPVAAAQALRTRLPGLQCHLVLPANLSAASARRAWGGGATWDGALLTKLDDCEVPWGVLQLLCDRGVPLGCTSAHPDAQVDARAFDAARLLDDPFGALAQALAAGEPGPAGPPPRAAAAAPAAGALQ